MSWRESHLPVLTLPGSRIRIATQKAALLSGYFPGNFWMHTRNDRLERCIESRSGAVGHILSLILSIVDKTFVEEVRYLVLCHNALSGGHRMILYDQRFKRQLKDNQTYTS